MVSPRISMHSADNSFDFYSGFFALAATITTVGIVSERASGSWDRILVAGVKPRQILSSQLIVGVMMMVLQFIEIFAYIVFAYGSSDLNLSFLVVSGFLLFLSGLCGLLFGLLCSIVMKTILSAYVISQGAIYPISIISGESSISMLVMHSITILHLLKVQCGQWKECQEGCVISANCSRSQRQYQP